MKVVPSELIDVGRYGFEEREGSGMRGAGAFSSVRTDEMAATRESSVVYFVDSRIQYRDVQYWPGFLAPETPFRAGET